MARFAVRRPARCPGPLTITWPRPPGYASAIPCRPERRLFPCIQIGGGPAQSAGRRLEGLRAISTSSCLFVCLFVGIKPEKLYSASFVWREVKPLGVIVHGLRHFYDDGFACLLGFRPHSEDHHSCNFVCLFVCWVNKT